MLTFEAAHTQGVIGFRSSLVSSAKLFIGPAIQTEVSAGYVVVNGEIVEARLYSVTENGKPLTGALRKRLEDGIQRDVRTRRISPLRRADASEYRYSVVGDCGNCGTSEMRVHFVARVRDAAHVNGDLWLEATGRPVRMASTPMVTASATVSTFAAVGPNLWAISQQTVRARVKKFFITADSNSVQLLTHYRRFPSLRAAHAALAAGM